jgi:antitoxin (DNA-binding transcriptional repressor) of toxin-antitoxin stability system
MNRVITQRELRNQSAAVLREVKAGRTFVLTRNGTAVAELRPIRPRRFVSRAVIAAGPVAVGHRLYGRMFAASRTAGQSSRSRVADLLIAATAAANSPPLYSRNPDNFRALKEIVRIFAI